MKLATLIIVTLITALLPAELAAIEVRVSEAMASPGDKVTVSIDVDNISGVAGFDITLEYDSTKLIVKDVRQTDVVKALDPLINKNVAGVIRIAAAKLNPLQAGKGAIFEIDFEIKQDAKGEIQLKLSDVSFFNEMAEKINVTKKTDGVIKVIEKPVITPKKLTATTATAKLGESVTVGIEIDDTLGIAGFDISIGYDQSIVTLESVKATELLQGYSVVINTDTAGKVVIAMASVKSLPVGKGTIFNMTFKCNSVGESNLEFESVSLFDENAMEIKVTTVNGKITVAKSAPAGPPVIKEPKGKMLTLQATFKEADKPAYVYIDIWKGEIPIKAGMFLEFQVSMFSGNPTFQGSVDLITSDGKNLRDSGAVDQNNISAHPSADLSKFARDQWYHRKISLDKLSGKTITGFMIATDSDKHRSGPFRLYVDNIQITDGESILSAIYLDEDKIPITGGPTSTETNFAGTAGMVDYSVSIVGETPVTPAGKIVSTWAGLKSRS